jgi:hypothetical protein
MKTRTLLLVASLVAVIPFQAHAGAPPASAPTTQPPAPPRKVVMPPGFKLVQVNGRNVFCEAADESWVSMALQKIQPTTKPATMPATLLQKLTSQRDTLLRQIAVDLALRDLTAAARTYDLDLVAPIRQVDQYKPPVFFLVASPERMADLMRNGWNDPHFYYNRAADAVSFNPTGMLTTDRPQDEGIFPAGYEAKDPPEKRGEAMTISIGSVEASIQRSIELRATNLVGAQLATIVQTQGVDPLALKDDQQWFGSGIGTILSAKYDSMITGDNRAAAVQMLTFDPPNHPVPGTAIDLLHLMNEKDMRQDMLPYYYDAIRRKAGRAIQAMIDKAGGDAAIPKAITAVRDKKPADAAALAKVVQDATGFDLAAVLVKGS